MKAVLISIQPKWCELIAIGKKSIEVRKTRPNLEVPFKCYIYCTVPNGKYLHRCKDSDKEWYVDHKQYCDGTIYGGKVIGEFMCDKIEEFTTDYRGNEEQNERIEAESCVSMDKLIEYQSERYLLYAWHISDLNIYDTPKEISEFISCQKCKLDGICGEISKNECGSFPVKKSPQSWFYVEELEGHE